MNFACIALVLLCEVFKIISGSENFQVKLPSGIVQGYPSTSVNGKTYVSFEGIPYAQPPVGNNRFKDPQPVKPWIDVLKANTLYKCMQYRQLHGPSEEPIAGEEDCLYINVYTPSLNENSKLDVIIFIHGGALMYFEPGFFGPKFLLDRNVVYVNFNYRLGPLGFLSTEDKVLAGNYGLKDQVAALKWTKENIHHFGGNPDSITITGLSAGGSSVQIHYLSPLSKGLFNRGISQSGSALNSWILQENAREKAVRLAELLGCGTETSEHIATCLLQRSGRQIVNAVKEFQSFRYMPFAPFGVVVDKWSDNPLFPEHPYLLLQKGEIQDLPWIASHAEGEGLYPTAEFLAEEGLMQYVDEHWNDILPVMLEYNYTINPKEKDEISQRIRREYLKDLPVSRDTFYQLAEMSGDRLFVNDIQKAVRLQASKVNSPIHYYYFTYRGAHSSSEWLRQSNENLGACHGDDAILILSGVLDTQSTEQDRRMSKTLIDIWISFAKNGIPELPEDKPWPQVSKDTSEPLNYIKLASPDDIEALEERTFGNPDFWNSLPFEENEHLFSQTKTKTEL